MSVSQAIAAFVNGEKQEITVTGYIVGFAPRGSTFKPTFATTNAGATNIVLADTPDETDATKCIPIELPSGTDIRDKVNLQSYPENLGKKVTITGSLEAYFSTAGLKSPTAYTLE